MRRAPSPARTARALALLLGLLAAAPAPAAAQDPAGRWQPLADTASRSRQLQWDGSATLRGRALAVRVTFYANPTRSREATGALGLDLVVADAAALAPFDIDSFEGPDAPAQARELVRLTVTRAGKPPLSVTAPASGWSPDGPNFAFGVSALVTAPSSVPKTVLRALAEGAERLEVTVTDYKDARLALTIAIPVASRRADFEALLAGIR